MPTPRTPIPRAALRAIDEAQAQLNEIARLAHQISIGASRDARADVHEISRLAALALADLNDAKKSSMPHVRKPQIGLNVQYHASGRIYAATIVATNGQTVDLVVYFERGPTRVEAVLPDQWNYLED